MEAKIIERYDCELTIDQTWHIEEEIAKRMLSHFGSFSKPRYLAIRGKFSSVYKVVLIRLTPDLIVVI